MKFESKKGTKVAPLTANQVVPLGANQVAPLRRKWNGSIAVQINSMDRLARNLDDLRQIVKGLTNRGINVRFVKECLTFTSDADSPMSNLLLSMMGAFAEFERSLIKERQREGIELAKKKGIYKGRVKSLSSDEIIILNERVKLGANKSALAKEFGISRQTLYAYLN